MLSDIEKLTIQVERLVEDNKKGATWEWGRDGINFDFVEECGCDTYGIENRLDTIEKKLDKIIRYIEVQSTAS